MCVSISGVPLRIVVAQAPGCDGGGSGKFVGTTFLREPAFAGLLTGGAVYMAAQLYGCIVKCQHKATSLLGCLTHRSSDAGTVAHVWPAITQGWQIKQNAEDPAKQR